MLSLSALMGCFRSLISIFLFMLTTDLLMSSNRRSTDSFFKDSVLSFFHVNTCLIVYLCDRYATYIYGISFLTLVLIQFTIHVASIFAIGESKIISHMVDSGPLIFPSFCKEWHTVRNLSCYICCFCNVVKCICIFLVDYFWYMLEQLSRYLTATHGIHGFELYCGSHL